MPLEMAQSESNSGACCFICSLRKVGVNEAFARDLMTGYINLEAFATEWGDAENEAAGNLNREEEGLVKTAAENALLNNLPVIHDFYYQTKVIPFGEPQLTSKFKNGGLEAGMLLEIMDTTVSTNDEIGKLVTPFIHSSLDRVVTDDCYSNLPYVQQFNTVVLKTHDRDRGYSNLTKTGFQMINFQFNQDAQFISNYWFTEAEEELAELANGVRVVVIDKLVPIEDARTPGTRMEPSLNSWLDMIRRCLGDLSKLILIAVYEEADFWTANAPAQVFQTAERELVPDIHPYRLQIGGANQEDWILQQVHLEE